MRVTRAFSSDLWGDRDGFAAPNDPSFHIWGRTDRPEYIYAKFHPRRKRWHAAYDRLDEADYHLQTHNPGAPSVAWVEVDEGVYLNDVTDEELYRIPLRGDTVEMPDTIFLCTSGDDPRTVYALDSCPTDLPEGRRATRMPLKNGYRVW